MVQLGRVFAPFRGNVPNRQPAAEPQSQELYPAHGRRAGLLGRSLLNGRGLAQKGPGPGPVERVFGPRVVRREVGWESGIELLAGLVPAGDVPGRPEQERPEPARPTGVDLLQEAAGTEP